MKGGDDEERQIVVFTLSDEEFGVNISDVREIIRMEEITKIPNTAEYIEGVINLRGGIVVVINLAMKLGLPLRKANTDTRIIVLEVVGNTVGMIVDSATEVMRLNSDQVEPAPSIIAKRVSSDYLEGVGIIGERLLILLDLSKVLVDEDYEHIDNIQKTIEGENLLDEEQLDELKTLEKKPK
ncbi:MAG: purine-binding chemotaxis protein CheW [Candidatus Altiarchaeota archaeon]|nr:purine-binding chemotaxis protein CheW [Candidatus Altiarchaeota archaeon]